jgi:hypothetical protein
MTPEDSCDHLTVASSDEDDLALHGWDVLVVGQQQAWPFVTFAGPPPERSQRTLWIDTDFAVTDGDGRELAGPALARLEPLIVLFVSEVTAGDDELVIAFDDGSSLSVSNAPNAPESQGWWIGRTTGR